MNIYIAEVVDDDGYVHVKVFRQRDKALKYAKKKYIYLYEDELTENDLKLRFRDYCKISKKTIIF